MKYFAVAGSPILHSKSPQVFNHFFKQTGVDARYTRILAESAEEVIFLYRQLGLSGMSVTAPFKTEIMPLLDHIDERALAIGSVNTVVEKEGQLWGYNTDYNGVVDTLKDIKGKKVLLLGAGGASKAVAYAIATEKGELTIYNRTLNKAQELAQKYEAEVCGQEQLEAKVAEVDIIINTLPAGVKVLENKWLSSNQTVLDAVYHHSEYEDVCVAKKILFFSGKNWLVNQAIPAYKLFLGIEDDIRLDFPDLSCDNKHDKIAFIGFMGTGKSMVGERVSKQIDSRFFCTDSMIVQKENKSINEIFQERGEAYFRQMEKDVLNLLSSMNGKAVIASGGGMVLDADNRELIDKKFISICLYSSPECILSDVNPSGRPLLKNNFNMEAIQNLLSERNPHYMQSADMVINSGHKNSDELAQKIAQELYKIDYCSKEIKK